MYVLDFVLLVLGIVLDTKCGLGVSPIISVTYTPSAKIGNTTFVLYSAFDVLEVILHAIRKQPKKSFCLIRFKLS